MPKRKTGKFEDNMILYINTFRKHRVRAQSLTLGNYYFFENLKIAKIENLLVAHMSESKEGSIEEVTSKEILLSILDNEKKYNLQETKDVLQIDSLHKKGENEKEKQIFEITLETNTFTSCAVQESTTVTFSDIESHKISPIEHIKVNYSTLDRIDSPGLCGLYNTKLLKDAIVCR